MTRTSVPALLGALLALGLLGGACSGAAAKTRPGTVAFVRFSETTGHPQVWLLPSGSSRARRLKLPFTAVDGPAWSPDGTSLIVVAGRNQTDQPRVTQADDLYLVGADGHRIRRLTHGAAHESGVAWAPSGAKIAFVRSPASAPNQSSVFVASPTGGAARRLTFGSSDLEPSWDSTGRWIAFLRIDPKRHTNGIWLVRPDGRGLHRILRGLSNVTDPVWAPHGSRLLVTDGRHLIVARADGSDTRMLTELATDEHGGRFDPEPAWSPDGARVVFVQARAGAADRADLWSVNEAGGRLTRLTRSPGLDLSPTWGR